MRFWVISEKKKKENESAFLFYDASLNLVDARLSYAMDILARKTDRGCSVITARSCRDCLQKIHLNIGIVLFYKVLVYKIKIVFVKF